MKNYYRILNIRSNATADEIKAAYRNLAKRYHPDANPGDKAAAAKFAEINEANDTLSVPEKRSAYDKQLRLEVLRRQNAANAAAFAQRRPLSAQAEMQAKLQAQAQAEMQAAIQAGVQAQLVGVRDRAYKEGYERGNKEGQAYAAKTLAAQNETYKQKISESARDRSDLEQELFDRDRELNKANEKIRELTVQLQWLKKATSGADADPLRAPLENSKTRVRELENAIAAIRIKPSDVSSSATAAVSQKRMQLSDRFKTLHQTLNDLDAEINSLRALNDRQTRIAENEKLLSSLEARAAQWAKKQKDDIRPAKSTLYGS
ncbi:MAG: DnaJ domain-containing protein, partial [Clostridiales bacterium]|nr:DnaJ domain-containing protein [Clostridiales bacterium]